MKFVTLTSPVHSTAPPTKKRTMTPSAAFTALSPSWSGQTATTSSSHVCGATQSCCGRPHSPLVPCSFTPGPPSSRRAFGGRPLPRAPRPVHATVRAVLQTNRPWQRGLGVGSKAAQGAQCLASLLAENLAFVEGHERIHGADRLLATRAALKDGQAPKVAIVACADSRVAPELLFRAALGELFVMRVAGNTTGGDQVLGSLQYAVDVLGVQLVLVLGHTKCGAVAAACAGAKLEPTALRDHVESIKTDVKGLDDVDEAVRKNVSVNVLSFEGDLRRRGVKDAPLVQGAVYDIETGAVSLVENVVAGNGWLQ